MSDASQSCAHIPDLGKLASLHPEKSERAVFARVSAKRLVSINYLDVSCRVEQISCNRAESHKDLYKFQIVTPRSDDRSSEPSSSWSNDNDLTAMKKTAINSVNGNMSDNDDDDEDLEVLKEAALLSMCRTAPARASTNINSRLSPSCGNDNIF